MKRRELKGKRSGRLVAISISHVERHVYWQCRCDCGNFTVIRAGRFGETMSCGCLVSDTSRKLASLLNYRHGMVGTKEYGAWKHMKARCYHKKNINFQNYGGRGIKVCKRWQHSFEDFYADVGPAPSKKHSIDRKRVNGHYYPSNVQWATRKQQDSNKRRTK